MLQWKNEGSTPTITTRQETFMGSANDEYHPYMKMTVFLKAPPLWKPFLITLRNGERKKKASWYPYHL
jgi:hypothetical protein